MTRLDYIFSHWLLIWYASYMIIGNKHISNPKIAFIFGLIHNLIIIILMLKKKTKVPIILLFSIMVIVIKIIPLYTLHNTNININDFRTLYLLLLCYFFWLTFNKQPMLKYIVDFDYIIRENNKFMAILFKNI